MRHFYPGFILCVLVLASIDVVYAQTIHLSFEDIPWIGKKIFENECGDKDEYLIQWNEGEEFLSLGIGHFIWYPRGQTGPFEETFPQFLEYLKNTRIYIPAWLNVRPVPQCPWNSREEFLRDRQGPKVQELRHFLIATKSQQGHFLIKRLEDALPLMLKNVSLIKQNQVREQFNRVTSTSAGIFALVDYINFKGLGILATERYQGKGWGLLQVLSEMKGKEYGRKALEEFVQAAQKILTDRVNNAPPERNERKWLAGWQRRVNTYLDFKQNTY